MLPAAVLLVLSTALSVTAQWGATWSHPELDLGTWGSALDFYAVLPVYPMLTLTAFALGALVGLLLHRVIPALGVAFALFGALGWALEQVRPYLLPMHLAIGGGGRAMAGDSWVYASGVMFQGRRTTYDACPGPDYCAHAPRWVQFHPAGDFAPMVAIMTGILAAVTALLLLGAYRRLRALSH
jgi:hypothetical protein